MALVGTPHLIVPFHEVPSQAWFVEALDALSLFYRFVDLDELLAAAAAGRRRAVCHVTFDDGHRSFAEHALPVLRDRAIPTTLFVSPAVIAERGAYWFEDYRTLAARLGDERFRVEVSRHLGCRVEALAGFSLFSVFLCLPIASIRRLLDELGEAHAVTLPRGSNMTVEQLRQAAQSGVVVVGGHTINHPVLANETDAQAEYEIVESVRRLREMLGHTVTRFAYPNGTEGLDFTAREQRMLQAAGVNAAVTTDVGFVPRALNRWALPRGGCPSLQGEAWAVRAARLAFLPFWNGARQLGRRAASQAEERRAIRAAGVIPTAAMSAS